MKIYIFLRKETRKTALLAADIDEDIRECIRASFVFGLFPHPGAMISGLFAERDVENAFSLQASFFGWSM